MSNIFWNLYRNFNEQLKKKNDVKIVNFGIFKIKKNKERICRNPKTKVEVLITERNVVKFKASDFLLNTINTIQSNLDEKSWCS